MTSNTCDNVIVLNGGQGECTITNDDVQGTLIVNKVVVNDNGGTATPDAFTFSYGLDGQPGTDASFEADGSNSLAVNAGTYDVTETPITGYTMTSNTCDNVIVPNGGSAECTITNDDQQGTLIVHKQVINDNGGTLGATDFTFQVNGGVATGFAPDGDDALLGKNSLAVDSGTYTVTEPAVIGYTSDVSDCAGVFVPSGGIGECTITNDDQPGTLIVKKIVINDNGGNLKATDFSFQVNSGDVTPFLQDGDNALLGKNSLTVGSGYYTVTEPAVSGYTADVSGCAGVFVPNGLTAECTITNDDQPGTLIVKKIVINDNGGSSTASDFAFDYGPVGGAMTNQLFEPDGVNEITVNAGAYNVTELAAFGYTTAYDNCTGVLVPNGGSATCTITNDDQPGTLIVNKLVVNDNGDTKMATDFSFEVNGGDPVPFSQDGADILKGRNSLTVDAGTYVVTEPAVPGYTADVSDCAGVVVVNGGTSECTIVNDDSKASPAGSTAQRWVLHDSLTINQLRPGAPDAAPEVTFKLFSSDTCSIDSQVGADESATLNGTTATTVTGVLVESPGTYYWTVDYPGDQYNNPFTTECGKEFTTITAANE